MQLLDASSGEHILLRVVQGFIACYAATLLLSLWAVSVSSPETESQGDSSSMHPTASPAIICNIATVQYVYVAIWGVVYTYFNYTINCTVKVLCECTLTLTLTQCLPSINAI